MLWTEVPDFLCWFHMSYYLFIWIMGPDHQRNIQEAKNTHITLVKHLYWKEEDISSDFSNVWKIFLSFLEEEVMQDLFLVVSFPYLFSLCNQNSIVLFRQTTSSKCFKGFAKTKNTPKGNQQTPYTSVNTRLIMSKTKSLKQKNKINSTYIFK